MDIYSLLALKGGIREYIDLLISIYTIYDEKEVIDYLKELHRELENVNNYDELSKIKQAIIKIQDDNIIDTNKKIFNDNTKLNRELTDREMGLIKRGYSKDDLIELCGYSDNQFKTIADIIISNISQNCNTLNNPTCLFIGGQPGCGKSTISLLLKDYFAKDGAIEICIDDYRSYHPNYLKMEEVINKHWVNRKPTENDSPGNDIADFTHKFAGDMTDYIVEKLINTDNNKYNLIIEWGMRSPEEPLKMMKELKRIGYTNKVLFVVVDKKSSYEACVLRANAMDGVVHIIRRIPKDFHDLCVHTLPESCNKIYNEGFINNKYIDQFLLISRDGKVLWNNNNDKLSDIYNNYLK